MGLLCLLSDLREEKLVLSYAVTMFKIEATPLDIVHRLYVI